MTRKELNEDIQNEIFKEQNKNFIKSTIKKILLTIFILVLVSFLFFTYTTYISNVKIKVREYRITNKNIPDSFNGLKIIQISDLHYGSTMFHKDLIKIVNLINERNPDLVLFTGDLISKEYKITPKEKEKLTTELKKINSNLGKYAIKGNEDKEEFSTILNQSDFIILNNEYELIYKDNNPILLIGLNSSLTNEQDINKAYDYFNQENYNDNIYTITMLHEPDSVDDILNNYKTNLFLAGHSHNGNIRIPYLNFSIIRPKGAYKYYQDYYKINDSKLYISSGLGLNNTSSIRLFTRPSINFFRLSNNKKGMK